MANQDIRRKAADAGIKLWQIADALGISDGTFSRRLRKEFTLEEKERVVNIIETLSKGGMD